MHPLGFDLSTSQLVIMAIAVAGMLVIHLVFGQTRLGKAMRATAANRSLAQASGIATERVVDAAWLISGVLCGLAGVVLVLNTSAFQSTTGSGFLVVIIAAAMLGGVGRPTGAMVGALVLGARAPALEGAEVCPFATGIVVDELGYTANWRTLVRARATENPMYTAITVHPFTPDFADRYRRSQAEEAPSASGLTRGVAMIASAERVLSMSEAPRILTADLDLERSRRLYETEEELIVPAPYATIPGVLGARRREILGDLASAAVHEPV